MGQFRVMRATELWQQTGAYYVRIQGMARQHSITLREEFDELDEDSFDDFDPESGELLLGDIVLCLPKIREQAAAFGHSTRREYAFLIAHSLLHLVGFDHMSPEDEVEMTDMQNTILDSLGITRDAG